MPVPNLPKSAGGGYGDSADTFCQIYRLQAAHSLVGGICWFAIPFLSESSMPAGVGEAEYDLTMLNLTSADISKLEQFGLVVASILWSKDGAISGTSPDAVIDGAELLYYFLSQLEALTCDELQQMAGKYELLPPPGVNLP